MYHQPAEFFLRPSNIPGSLAPATTCRLDIRDQQDKFDNGTETCDFGLNFPPVEFYNLWLSSSV